MLISREPRASFFDAALSNQCHSHCYASDSIAFYEDILFHQFALVDAEKSSAKLPHSKALCTKILTSHF